MSYDFVTFGRTKLYYIDDDLNIDSGVIDIIQPVNPGGSDSPDDIFVVRHRETGSQNEYIHINLKRKDVRFDYEDAKDMLIETLKKNNLMFGVKLSDMLGTVDSEGNYVYPVNTGMSNILDLNGVKTLPSYAFYYLSYNNKSNISGVYAPDLIDVSAYSFNYAWTAFKGNIKVNIGCETISGSNAFTSAFQNGASNNILDKDIIFPNLKIIKGSGAFSYAFGYVKPDFDLDKVFPNLEEITSSNIFNQFIYNQYNNFKIRLSKLKRISYNSTSSYSGTFYNVGSSNYQLIYEFPNLEEINGTYQFSTYTKEIHLPARFREQLEASKGYPTKWGATNATIYFDL